MPSFFTKEVNKKIRSSINDTRLVCEIWCTIYKTQKPSMSYSAWIDMQRVALSYLSKSCTPPAFNILYIQSGGGCYTADVCQRETSRMMMPAAFLSLLTADLVALASETRICMYGVAGIVSWIS